MHETAARSWTGRSDGIGAVRQVHVHDSAAPAATVVTPSVFVAVRDERGRLLMVRRSPSLRTSSSAPPAWFDPADVACLVVEPGAERWITRALSGALEPYLD